jgi:hypothetical protein
MPRGCGVNVSSEVEFPLGVQLSDVGLVTEGLAYLEPPVVCPNFDGDADGVVWRRGDGDTGDSGRRKGELRVEPYPNGDGL